MTNRMTARFADMSLRSAAKIAGGGYLMIILAGIFAEFVVRSGLIIKGDAAATVGNITASEGLFRLSIAGDLIMLTFDVVLALALYVLLRPVHKSLALLAVFFRLVHTAVYGLNLLNLFFVLDLVSGADYLASFEPEQLNAQIMVLLNGHAFGYLIGLIFFGFHCALIGYLVFRSGYIPRFLGALLIIAAAGYLIDGFAQILVPAYSANETLSIIVVAVPAVVGELSLSLWLLFRGRTLPEIRAESLEGVPSA